MIFVKYAKGKSSWMPVAYQIIYTKIDWRPLRKRLGILMNLKTAVAIFP